MSRKASTLHCNAIIPLIIAEGKRILPAEDFQHFVELVNDKREFAFGTLLSMMAVESKILEKDLKIQFDWENFDDANVWELSANGFWYLKMWAGGDWEWPVYFVIYWDGSNTRAYVPTNGNVFNRATKAAYGNDETSDAADILRQYGQALDPNDIQEDWVQMMADVNKRIII